VALAEKLATQSVLAIQQASADKNDYEHALLLAIQAFKADNTVTSRSALLRLIQPEYLHHTFWYSASDDVQHVAFSRYGDMLATGSDDNTIRLWDVASQRVLGQSLQGHTKWIADIAFSVDGKILASGSDDNTVRLWDVVNQQALGNPLRGHGSDVESVAFSPDGKILASGSWDRTIFLWNVAN